MSAPRLRDEERATSPDRPKRFRSPGCATFLALRRCSPVTDRCRYADSSRRGVMKDRQHRGFAEFFKSLLGIDTVLDTAEEVLDFTRADLGSGKFNRLGIPQADLWLNQPFPSRRGVTENLLSLL